MAEAYDKEVAEESQGQSLELMGSQVLQNKKFGFNKNIHSMFALDCLYCFVGFSLVNTID